MNGTPLSLTLFGVAVAFYVAALIGFAVGELVPRLIS